MLRELDAFAALADTAAVPVYNAPGNHEMQSSPEAVEVLREWGHDLYGSFDFRQLPLRRAEHRRGQPRGPHHRRAARVAARATSPPRAARGRCSSSCTGRCSPGSRATSTPTTPTLLHDLFRSHGVEAVFAAHDHFFYEERHDGIRYMTIGGAGGPLYTQPPAGGFAHYVLVTVRPGETEYNVVEPNHLEVDHLEGNDGRAPVSTARLANTTDRDIVARNLEFRVPRLPEPAAYRVSAIVRDFARVEVPLPAVPARLGPLPAPRPRWASRCRFRRAAACG